MYSTKQQSGFTLVELAIVMTIIGLLIGGILKGQELMMNARATATIAQVRSYEAAATTFRDSFASLPGDMQGAQNRLPGCTAACNPATATAGNSIIGISGWAGTTWATQAGVLAATNTEPRETVLFWIHLLQADLISGVSSDALSGVPIQWGVTHPQARINGGFVIGYASGAAVPPGSGGTTPPAGHHIALVGAPGAALDTTAGVQALTPGKAAQIDRKMDDGRPASGFVQAFGVTTSCFTSTTLLTYAETVTRNDCGLIFRVQG